jgi:hypothetical protein
MTQRKARIIALLPAFMLGLSACGTKADLEPAAGEVLPVKPAGAPKQPTPKELMTPSIQAKPERSDEPLKRSEERKEDEYDLPPPG